MSRLVGWFDACLRGVQTTIRQANNDAILYRSYSIPCFAIIIIRENINMQHKRDRNINYRKMVLKSYN